MHCAVCGSDARYVCGRSGRPLCPQHSRIEIVSKLSFGSSSKLSVREASKSDSKDIAKLAEYFWGSTKLMRFGKEYDVTKLPAFAAIANDHLAGALSYYPDSSEYAVIMLDVMPGYQGLGAGGMLLETLKDKATEEKKSGIVVSATNDDLSGIYFYQRNGFQIYEVVPDLIAEYNGKVQVGFAGIPCRDEIRLRMKIQPEQ